MAVGRIEDGSGLRGCGGCRQRIREFAVDGAIPVSFPWSDGTLKTLQLDELLPYSFELQVRPRR